MTGVEVAPVGLGHMQTAPAFHRGWGRFLLAVKPASYNFWRAFIQFLAGLGAGSQNLRLASLRAFCKPLLDPAIAS